MAIDPNDAGNIPPTSTGPKTEAGKSKSSRNSLKFGLFTAHDFIREGEEEECADTFTSLTSELTPENSVEETFLLEIIGATWRLRRCRLVEEAFGNIGDHGCGPMVDERTEKQQKSAAAPEPSRTSSSRSKSPIRCQLQNRPRSEFVL